MFNGQAGYQQPPWQQGFNQASQRTGPPPAKKPRSNPIITRYPPPPGYKGPAQPQVPWQQQAYQPQAYQPQAYQHQAYQHQAYQHQAYQQQAYQQQAYQPQVYPQQAYQQQAHQQQAYQQQAYQHLAYQHQAYQQQPTWNPTTQTYGIVPASYPGYTQQSYGTPQYYHQPSMPSYPIKQEYPQAQNPTMNHPQENHNPPPQHAQSHSTSKLPAWQRPILADQSMPPPQGNPQASTSQKRRHHSMASTDQNVGSFDRNDDFLPIKTEPEDDADEHVSEGNVWVEDDYYRECSFARNSDGFDEDLWLGIIVWRPPLPTKRALPATWSEVELEAIAPRKPSPTDDESVSAYFIKAKRHEVLLSIRQTEHWAHAKDDPAFTEFPPNCIELIPTAELSERYRYQPDPDWSARAFSPTPDPEIKAEEDDDTNAGAMAVDDRNAEDTRSSFSGAGQSDGDVLGNLEQALQQNGASQHSRHSRASSVASSSSQHLTRPTPLIPVRDQAQEDRLAALGVSGTLNVVYQTPGPALGAHQQQRDGMISRDSRNNSFTGSYGGSRVPPPPPPPLGHPPNYRSPYDMQAGDSRPSSRGYDNSRRGHANNRRGYDSSRRGSNASHRTASGSDFNSEDQDATPRQKYYERRKRRHDSESDTPDESRRQEDDDTPRQRRKHHKIEENPWTARR